MENHGKSWKIMENHGKIMQICVLCVFKIVGSFFVFIRQDFREF